MSAQSDGGNSLRKWRGALVSVLAVVGAISVVSITPDLAAWVLGARPDNRYQLYALRRVIQPGTKRDELIGLLKRHETPMIRHKWKSNDEVVIWVPTGFLETSYLRLQFRGESVVHAQIRGDRGEQDRLPDAPDDF